MTQGPKLLGLGVYLPETIMTNADISRMVETDDAWIVSRTGIRQRHIIGEGQDNSDMALAAAEQALLRAGVQAGELTHLLYATCTPDAYCPPTACILAAKLGCPGIFALDINAACSGFVYGLSLARDMLAAQPGSTILLVASEALSTRTNWSDRSTCVLFGDGAAAAVFCAGASRPEQAGVASLQDVRVSSDGGQHQLLHIDGGGTSARYALGDTVRPDFFVRMEGREVYKYAVRHMADICREILEAHQLTVRDVDLFIPHQANLRIINAVGEKLGFAAEHVFVNVDTVGNTSSASIPLALAEAQAAGRVPPGTRALLCTFGGGLTWGAALLDF